MDKEKLYCIHDKSIISLDEKDLYKDIKILHLKTRVYNLLRRSRINDMHTLGKFIYNGKLRDIQGIGDKWAMDIEYAYINYKRKGGSKATLK